MRCGERQTTWWTWLGVDRGLALVLVGRAWSFLAGPVTILLIGTQFTEPQQGFFYTFNRVLGLQVFLELGLSQGLIQFASHEFARLRFAERGRLVGEEAARQRLRALGRLALGWYAAAALLVLLGIGLAGHAFFQATPEAGGVSWRAGWWLLVGATALNLLTQPVWFLLEGCNQIAGVAAYRAGALAVSGLVLWAGILAGGGLMAAGWAALAGFLVSVAWLAGRWRGFVRELLSHRGAVGGMLRELWPFQWRMALSAMSGYLIFSLFEPTVFRFRGAAEAGRMGMSWQLVNALSVLSVSWISTRAPRFGILVREGRYDELDRLARRVAIQAVGICLVGAVSALVLLAWVKVHFELGARFLGLEAVALLAATAVLNQVVFAQAYYLRAHKQEPFMLISLLNGLLTAAGVIAGTWHYGAVGACVAYAATQLLVFPLATGVFLVKRREWHRPSTADARRRDGGPTATVANKPV